MNDNTKSTNKSSNVNSGSSILPSNVDNIKRKRPIPVIQQKNKRRTGSPHKITSTTKEKNSPNVKAFRKDRNGNDITSKNKKQVKVTFIDLVTSDLFVNITQVESYKEYNKVDRPLREDVYVKTIATCACIIY